MRVPRKQIQDAFLKIYELEGSKKATFFLCKYYKIRRMEIVVNGRKVRNAYLACYDQNVAYFRPKH